MDKDGTPWIAGIGNTSVLPHSIARTAEGGTSASGPSRNHALELTWPGALPNPTDPAHTTEASDMYGFGVMTWEVRKRSDSSGVFQSAHSGQVFTGRPPFSEMTEIAATYSMLNGTRPPRLDHHAIPDRVWHMIQRCWHSVPSKRMSAEKAVNLLGEELGRTSDSRALFRT